MFRGIITPIVTPFHRDDGQRINYEAAEELIEYVIANGVSGIFLLGSNGEFHVIDREEKIQFVREAVKIVNGRVPVFAGPGACSTQETVYLAKEMEAAGADALSVISPYFVQPTEEELYSHFRTVAESVKIPVILYNIPRLTGMNISAGLFDRLARQGCVAGIKDSSRSEENLRAYLEVAKRNNLAVLVGSDGMIARGYRMGASGAIAGMSNVIPKHMCSLFRALEEHREQDADELQQGVEAIRSVNKLGTMPSILKRALELGKIAQAGPARKPVKEPDAQTDQEILKMLEYYHLLDRQEKGNGGK